MPAEMLFHVYPNPNDFGHVIRIGRREDEKLYVAQPITWQEVKPGESTAETLPLSDVQTQALMDALWNARVRPSNGEGSVGQIGAVKDHAQYAMKTTDKLIALLERK